MDKCREEFESYLLNNGYSKDALHKSQYCDYYSRSFTRELWKAWLASRESMKAIKLPVLPITMPIDYRIGFSDAVNRCEDAITSAGYKVEE